jgi:AraC-like DNA-binding protein
MSGRSNLLTGRTNSTARGRANGEAREPLPGSGRERQLQSAMEFIHRTFHRRPTVAEIAKAGRLSTFHFHRLFKKRFGETAFEVVVRLQVERAKELMLQGVPLADVGRRVGFNSQSHFSTRFKQATGVTPARWLRQNAPAPRRRRTGARIGARIGARAGSVLGLLSWLVSGLAWAFQSDYTDGGLLALLG